MSTPDSPPLLNPFVGPAPLPCDRQVYGRRAEVRELFYRLVAERIVWLHSPSGAGKTSLVQAKKGLVDYLEDDGFEVWPSARVGTFDKRINCPSSTEASPPNRYVLSALLSLEANLSEHDKTPIEALKGLTLDDYITRRRERFGPSESVVIIFDQFEEIITADALDIEAKRDFFIQAGKALGDPNLWALFILREEYLAVFDPYISLIPTRMKNRLRLDLLGIEAARQAVTSTTEDGGRVFAEEAATQLVADLARMKVQQFDGSFVEKTGHHVEPVQLQVVCRRLWERLPEDALSIDRKDLEQFGDVTQALVSYYEDSIEEITRSHTTRTRSIREWFGKKLITASGIRKQVLRGTESSDGLPNQVIEQLLSKFLIRAEQRAGATWYELVHDRFIDPIQESNSKWFAIRRRRRLVATFLAATLLAALGATHLVHKTRLASAEVSQLALDILKDHPPRSHFCRP